MREEQTTTRGNNMNTTNVTDITAKYTADQIGNETDRAELIKTIADAPKGGIIHVHAYESKGGYGEVANYYYLKGVDYGKMKERSLNMLAEMSADKTLEITTVRNAWKNADGTYTAYKSKDRTFERNVRVTYKSDNPLFIEAVATARKSILKPRQTSKVYNQEGNGIYSEENGQLSIRDCQLIHKDILREGEYPNKAKGEVTALKAKLESLTPYGKYRQVSLDGRFDYITVGGQLVMQSEGGERNFTGFAEHKGMLKTRINGLEESLPSVKVPNETLVPNPIAKEIQELIDSIF